MPSSYSAFGLTLTSDITFPELVAAPATSATDVLIREMTIDETDYSGYENHRLYFHSSQDQLLLTIPEIAQFRISAGNLIEYDPIPGVDSQTIRLYLLGSCMGALFHQRRMLVIHATTVKFGDACAVFAGDSGIGKSTLALALHQRGYPVLGDDLCVVDGNNKVHPSYPQLKLWRDTTQRLDIDTQQLRLIRNQVCKYAYPLNSGFFAEPLPIRAVYLLTTWNKHSINLTELHGLEKFNGLRNNTYRLEYLEGTQLQQAHMKNCSSLANSIRMKIIERPEAGFEIHNLVESIDADMNANA